MCVRNGAGPKPRVGGLRRSSPPPAAASCGSIGSSNRAPNVTRATVRDEAFELGGARPFATRGPTMREGVGLKSGALLVREWNNRLERVMVLDDGYAWNGGVYRSLSQLAKAITGTSWNGHRFFGLKAVRNGASSRRRSAAPRPNPLLDTGMPTLAAFAPASVDRSLPLATKEANPRQGRRLEAEGDLDGRSGSARLPCREPRPHLHVVEDEAEFVRAFFHRYLEVGSVVRLKTALDAENVRSPVRMSGSGRKSGGARISRATSTGSCRTRSMSGGWRAAFRAGSASCV